MGIDAKEKTALGSSVGADEGQPIQKDNNNSISNSNPKINDPASKTKESMRDKRRKMQSMFDPNSLYTISMTELYQNTYKSRVTPKFCVKSNECRNGAKFGSLPNFV